MNFDVHWWGVPGSNPDITVLVWDRVARVRCPLFVSQDVRQEAGVVNGLRHTCGNVKYIQLPCKEGDMRVFFQIRENFNVFDGRHAGTNGGVWGSFVVKQNSTNTVVILLCEDYTREI